MWHAVLALLILTMPITALAKTRHLLVSRAERDAMVKDIDRWGPTINDKNPNYVVAGALVLKDLLADNGHASSDEP